jgi:hypothetical protein
MQVRPNGVELTEEKKRSRPLAFGKSSKVWEESACSTGGALLPSDQPKKIWTMDLSRQIGRRAHREEQV